MGVRVKVWRDSNNYLGEGELLGNVLMSEVYSEEEAWEQFKCFIGQVGIIPDELARKHHKESYNIQTTPKIKLDNGQIVYGCQIWWEEINKTEE